MLNAIDALFDGQVFHPEQPVTLKANTRVRIIIENLSSEEKESTSFLDTAESLNLDGYSDWSANIDYYLYGEEKENES
ncbi:MAG: antitoxin family protein [Stigonema ocellatum SAG 48.90 = DSM 106950]|nr:antitoxin family protein [Stigonema ocellatum SAG 48.90 = DSM 106950]